MAKVQDTYNPVTGEYVKRISDWVELGGSLDGWFGNFGKYNGGRLALIPTNIGYAPNIKTIGNIEHIVTSFDSSLLTPTYNPLIGQANYSFFDMNNFGITVSQHNSGWNDAIELSPNEVKSYFYGWKMANADGTSPYYKSEVPYTPTTWAEWVTTIQTVTYDSTGISFLSSGCQANIPWPNVKALTKYGVLWNCVEKVSGTMTIGGGSSVIPDISQPNTIGNNKYVATTLSNITTRNKIFNIWASGTSQFKIKDIRVFELPAGSQIEADFANLSADELSAKYTFNGLCAKHWKKVTDGTGLTSTLPTASYAGYTPYKMIYQLATPEISYLTPKATIPLYDTNTIVETDTLSDCKADVTVGYKLKDGVTAVAGDITAPTPDYMSAVTSVSEDGDKKGIVRGKNLLSNKNPTTLTNAGITYTKGSDGSITLNGTSTSQSQYILAENITLKKGTYRFSGGVNYATLNFVENGNWIMVGNVEKTFTKDYTGNIILLTYDAGRVFSNVKIYPQLEEGSVATAFETYKTPVQATLPTLRKIGTVADTYNPETGVLVQRIGKKVFDGTELSSISIGDGNSVVITKPIENLYYGNTYYSPFIGSHHMKMTGVPNVDWSKSINYGKGCVSTSSALWLSVDNKKINTISEAQEWFAQQYANGTPVTVYYQLATPVVTTLATTALPTYKPTTVIESNSTIKGNVSADYKLKANATPVAGDFIASPECVNDIKDLGNSIDVVSSVGRRNIVRDSNKGITGWSWGIHSGSYTLEEVEALKVRAIKIKCNEKSASWAVLMRDLDTNKFKPNTDYTISYDIYSNIGFDIRPHIIRGDAQQPIIYNFETKAVSADMWNHISATGKSSTFSANGQVIYFSLSNLNPGNECIIANLKIEESVTASPYSASPEDIPYNTTTNGVYKTNILLSAPLRNVGDVKDSLFKDSDGKWKIERNIGEVLLNGPHGWNLAGELANVNGLTVYNNALTNVKPATPIICDKIRTLLVGYDNTSPGSPITNAMFVQTNGMLILNIGVDKLTKKTPNAIRTYLAANPMTVQYQLKTPTYETLSQELQTKLDNIPTFPEHNYVYTVTNNNLQPTLHVDYKKLSWLKSRLLLNSLKIYSRNLTDTEMVQNYQIEKERYGM